jgi:hypothetical protein
MLIEPERTRSRPNTGEMVMLAILFNAVARPELAPVDQPVRQLAGMGTHYWLVVLAAIVLVMRRPIADRLRGAIQARC